MSLISKHPAEFLMLIAAGELTRRFSSHEGYWEFNNHLLELVDELALDHVASIHARCAESEFAAGQFEEAMRYIETVRNLQPPSHLAVGRVKKILGYICTHQGNLDTGKMHLEEAVANFEQNGSAEQLEAMKRELVAFAEASHQYPSHTYQPLISQCNNAISRLLQN